MKQTIRFKGLSLNRDEIAAEHGELSLCGGVELHDGALRPSVVVGSNLAGGAALAGTLIYVHQTKSYTNYITVEVSGGSQVMRYASAGSSSWNTQTFSYSGDFSPVQIVDVKHVGNTLCVMTSTGLHYFLYSITAGSYTYLGKQPPFLGLNFNLKLDTYHAVKNPDGADHGNGDTFWIDYSGSWYNSTATAGKYEVKEEARSNITDQVMAKINKRIADLTNDGYFYAPFFVRYCYRMYDGKSLILHSPAVLMFSDLNHPVSTRFAHLDDPVADDNQYTVWLFRSKLQVRVVDLGVITQLQQWKDIVKSVDIFVSPQVARIDTSSMIESLSRDIISDYHRSLTDGKYTSNIIQDWYPGWLTGFDLPEIDQAAYFARIKNTSTFFKLASYSVEKLGQSFPDGSLYNVDSSNLPNLAAQEQMTDDYKTHNLLVPDGGNGGLYVYNHRLNVYGISEQLFEGFRPDVMFPYVSPSDPYANSITSVGVWVSTEYGMRYLSITPASGVTWYGLPFLIQVSYVFYPDSRAILMGFTIQGGSSFYRNLVPASALNGAFACLEGSLGSALTIPGSPTAAVPLSNKIYTSRADNPFYFPNLPGESGINSVGTGQIIGVGAVTRALSAGQVGDHDLVVFSSDGVWVLKVSPEGTYSQVHNISRNVCVNKKSILQLDQSLLFASGKDLLRFVESDFISITDILDGPEFLSTQLSSFYNYLADPEASTYDANMKKLLDGLALQYQLETGQTVYDFKNARIFVLPAQLSVGIALVYSIRDNAWSTMVIPASQAWINSYPYPYLQKADGSVMALDKSYDEITDTNTYKGVVITRTLSFSDTMDVIRAFRQYTDANRAQMMFFFGSNDQITWQAIGTSARPFSEYLPGKPFRFFRVAFYLQLTTSERYQALGVEIINKYAKL